MRGITTTSHIAPLLVILLVQLFHTGGSPAGGYGGGDNNAEGDQAAPEAASSAAASADASADASASVDSEASASADASADAESNAHHSEDMHDMHIHTEPHLPSDADSRLHPTHEEFNDCKYDGDWQDCDPFKMVRIKELSLISGGSACVDKKNISKACSREDFPPGTVWLLQQHKRCVSELQKLKTMIEDLHRYIDLIHQRGQSLFNAYNDLRKHLMDIRREISNLGRLNHAAEQTIARLKKDVEEWKTKSNKMQMDLNQMRAQYKQLEVEVKDQKATLETCQKSKEEKGAEQARLKQKLYDINGENRDLKAKLLDAERYKEELRELLKLIATFKSKIAAVNLDITKTKDQLNQCKIDGLEISHLYKKGPKINKDTKVNLDMNMWITHNITQEEQPDEVYQPLAYGQNPAYYNTKPTYAPPKYEPGKYSPEPEESTYAPEAPNEDGPKYEEPKYEEPATKYEEPAKYEPTEPPKYEPTEAY